ncbi:hypothetical protein CC1G_01655 [Coprinopsis cinerea okayama7|uniref:Uncharacterized protein n=1 Tax=Coprinopsis cinerea (strain Okayama-7 / 130 / ATCC MYA-4618 / FGSC 9003) TaxID=240176 RepID=A8NIE0_COPC7|nr:hypothetical protein CC1G_01655 [Coprinopsis cinerea okayama7\|eukprot:XP_001833978.1 hypothetical protein CC1G_01655 [Coprinopsis cinerea okayama7\
MRVHVIVKSLVVVLAGLKYTSAYHNDYANDLAARDFLYEARDLVDAESLWTREDILSEFTTRELLEEIFERHGGASGGRPKIKISDSREAPIKDPPSPTSPLSDIIDQFPSPPSRRRKP